jgi:hypothetical protein
LLAEHHGFPVLNRKFGKLKTPANGGPQNMHNRNHHRGLGRLNQIPSDLQTGRQSKGLN